MGECVKVIVRCRPMNQREKDLKCSCVVAMDSKRALCSITNPADKKPVPKNFTFDGAYFTDSTTEQIYSEIAYPLVEGVTEGYNGTIFAYGQTGCGKSFSMQGIPNPATQRGIIPRSFAHIFETISLSGGTKFLIHASYLEIYNEEIRDLLGKDVKQKLDLKEHPEKGVYVNGLSLHPVHNVNECETIMAKGWTNRSTGATLMNADSSRSHSIFSISLEMINTDEEGEDHIRAGKLNLVDLAGSERQGKTGATGDRLKEATKINLSLSALGNVISALVDGKSKHIPYRDSKLTRLLQDSLGGNTKTMMVACLSPADNNYDETLSTLRYANRAKNIKNKPKINEDPKDALLRQYQEEIEKLKAMLAGQIPVEAGMAKDTQEKASRRKTATEDDESESGDEEAMREDLEFEKERIKQEYEEKMIEIQMAFEEERTNKAKLQEDMDKLRAFYDNKMRDVDGQLADLPTTAQEQKRKKKLSAASGAAIVGDSPASASNEDGNILGPDISDIGKPVILGPDGLPHMEKEVPSVKGAVAPQTLFSEQDQQLQQILQQQQLKIQQRQQANEEGVSRPNASPVGEDEMEAKQKEALARLMALQQQMVGGENANDEHAKEEHDKKVKMAEDIRQKLDKANRKMEDDGIVLNIFDSVQDELQAKNDTLLENKQQIESLERDIIDLQSEFEFDRVDYLDTIRKQERQIAYMESLVEKIHPCLRRDCNYYNLDRIKMESRYNEDEDRWVMPRMTIDKTALPVTESMLVLLTTAVAESPSFCWWLVRLCLKQRRVEISYLRGIPGLKSLVGKIHPCLRRDCNYYNLDRIKMESRYNDDEDRWVVPRMTIDKTALPVTDTILTPPKIESRHRPSVGNVDYDVDDERLREKLRRAEDQSHMFQPKRAAQLINTSQPIEKINMQEIRGTYKNNSPRTTSPAMNGFHGSGDPPMSRDLRAAQVHGQIHSDEMVRKPTRLDALPAVGAKKSRKKQKNLDPY